MSIQSARRQAENLIISIGIKHAPVNVEEVAKHLGLRVLSMELEEGVSGLLITKPDMSCIVINDGDPSVRQRFSIAHEIAHFCMKHQFEPGEHVHVDRGHRISHRDQRSSAGTDLKEIEANQFAASLLMPAALLKQSIEDLGTEELYDEHVTKLAAKFNVSEQAMTIRLSVLGLLS
jgi:Zn-dependent peptidase ImmA (M78 family)